MKPKHIQILGIVLSTAFAILILFLYSSEPRSIADFGQKATDTIGNVITKGQVVTGTYEVDQEKFSRGLQLFRSGDFPGSRSLFEAADPEQRDGRTQFYIAYSLYRQGWGRFASDNKLFEQGLEVAKRADKLLGGTFVSDDQDLKLKTPAALRNELEEGLRVTASDFNPLRALEERK
jgi:hypothetical protein